MSSCVHQRNLRITPTPPNLTKYVQKTLHTKTLLGRERTGKTFHGTEKKIRRNETQILTGFGNPVINKFSCSYRNYRDSQIVFGATYMIRGPRTKFADEGLVITFTLFRITRKIFQFGTCQFNIIARNAGP